MALTASPQPAARLGARLELVPDDQHCVESLQLRSMAAIPDRHVWRS
jgi:hypothetical protein